MTHLIDTDILIDLTRNNQGAIAYIDSLNNAWSICSITGLELIVGAKSQREVAEIDLLLATFETTHVTKSIEARAYRILKTYAKSHGIRTFDSLIAAAAIEQELTLASRNRKHFAMIEDLNLHVPDY
jgi:predicted nucleic acid-binding protein